MASPFTWIGVLWIAWLALWLFAAFWTARTVERQSPGGRMLHSIFFWAGGAILFSSAGRSGLLGREIFPSQPWMGWIGLAMTAIGLAFACWARIHLGRLWSGAVTLKEEHALVRTGPYGITRHPIYTGLAVAILGSALARATVGAVVGMVLVFVGIVIKLRDEEALLTKHFGEVYLAYKEQVPALIPRP